MSTSHMDETLEQVVFRSSSVIETRINRKVYMGEDLTKCWPIENFHRYHIS